MFMGAVIRPEKQAYDVGSRHHHPSETCASRKITPVCVFLCALGDSGSYQSSEVVPQRLGVSRSNPVTLVRSSLKFY